jgi:hypothetical protein
VVGGAISVRRQAGTIRNFFGAYENALMGDGATWH